MLQSHAAVWRAFALLERVGLITTPGGAATSHQNATKEEAKQSFRRPQDKPPSEGKKKDKRPRLNRPPKSDSDIIIHNKYKMFEIEIDNNKSSYSDYTKIFL